VRHPVCGTLGFIHVTVVFFPQCNITVIRDQQSECPDCLNSAIRMLIEYLEKIVFTRQQFGKKNSQFLKETSQIDDNF
jgi:hypothetical protein